MQTILVLNRKLTNKLYEKNIIQFLVSFNNETKEENIIKNRIYQKKINLNNKNLELICLYNNSFLLKKCLELELNWNYGLEGACKGGHLGLANLMIEKGADYWDLGLYGACLGGHLNLANLMIEKGANDWDCGLEASCLGGYKELVELMIKKGPNNWNLGLYGACERGHEEIANLMIKKGADHCDYCENTKHPKLK